MPTIYRGKGGLTAYQGVANYGPGRLPNDYRSQQSGVYRHQGNAAPNTGTPSALAANFYFVFNLLRFKRTFAPGVTDDTPPTATASNNYQNTDTFNGSRIENYKNKITITNTSSTITAILDVYETALSFWDGLIWNTVRSGTCPVTFDTTTVSPGDQRGTIGPKTPTGSIITLNDWSNVKFQQHYLKKRGTITIPNKDAGNNVVEIFINQVPGKVRRAQTGQYWGLFFHNDSTKNGSNTLALTATQEFSFDEKPSDNRLPYIS